VDAVVTDPPYGVNFDGKAGHYRNEPAAKRTDYVALMVNIPHKLLTSPSLDR
jgi:tRNA G10  N-methylase Trm11